MLAPWIISHFPRHTVYVEPFCGAANVLLRKRPSRVEVLNDLYGRVVSCFRVLRDPEQAKRLQELLRLTPCSEEEYLSCREASNDPVEDARRLIVLGHQGHGSTGASGGKLTGWRRGVRPHGPTSAREWGSLWEHVLEWADRLRGVYLENDDAIKVIERWDGPETLFYVDPPYMQSTRTSGPNGYAYEMTDEQHLKLIDCLRQVSGAVVLSGYRNSLYDDNLCDWHTVSRNVVVDRGAQRTEVLWLNAKAVAKRYLPLFKCERNFK